MWQVQFTLASAGGAIEVVRAAWGAVAGDWFVGDCFSGDGCVGACFVGGCFADGCVVAEFAVGWVAAGCVVGCSRRLRTGLEALKALTCRTFALVGC